MKRVYITIGLIFFLTIAGLLYFLTKGQSEKLNHRNIRKIEPELVYVKGQDPGKLIKPALWAIGGLESISIKGKKVLVKPSIVDCDSNIKGLNTNPVLIGNIIRECYDAGASEVYVTDHTLGNWTKCYKNSGIEKASKIAFGKIIPADDRIYYRFIELKDNKAGLNIHKLIETCEIIINVPALTISDEGNVRSGLYNLAGLTWENRYVFENGDKEMWIEYFKKFKPSFTIIDATNVNNLSFKGIIVSKDPLLAEAASVELMSNKVDSDSLMSMLEEQGIGITKVDKVSIQYVDIK